MTGRLGGTISASLTDEATGWLADLVRIPSVTGDETAAQAYVADLLRSLGLDVDCWTPPEDELRAHAAFCDDGTVVDARPVVVGRMRGASRATPVLVLNGHIDVVPAGPAWTYGPWSGNVVDGRLYGRGSCDMKGGLVSGILALAAFARAGVEPPGDVVLQSVIGEETGGLGTLAAILRGHTGDAAIILEPTRTAMCPVGAGSAGFRITVPGKAAHGAMRLEGVSAVDKLVPVLEALHELERSRHASWSHPLYEGVALAAPLSVGRVVAGDWPSTVPETCVAEGRYGVLPGESMSSARSQFEEAVSRAARSDDWLAAHPPIVAWFEGQFEPGATRTDAPVLAAVGRAHENLYGSAPRVHGVPYGSDLRLFTNHAGMDAVLYGPGDVALAHARDECVPLDEVFHTAQVVVEVMRQFGAR